MARVHDGMITANPEGALQCTVGEGGSSNGCAGNSSLVYCSMLSTRCPLSRSIPSLHGQVWRSRSAENGTWHTLANDPRDPSRIPTKRAKRARPVRRSSPSYPKTQTNSRLARRAVSIVIDPWRAPDLGRVEGDVGDSGSPYAQGNTVQQRDATLPGRRPGSRSWAKMDIKEARANWTRTCSASYATVAPASILGLSGGFFLAAAWPGQRPFSYVGANVALENRD